MAKSTSKDAGSAKSLAHSGGLTGLGNKSLSDYLRESTQNNSANATVPAIPPMTSRSPLTSAEQLGTLIHEHRLAKNISQADLADLASISIGTVKNAEQGRNIGVDQLFAIARALGMNIYA